MELEISTPSIGNRTPATTAATVPNRRTGISGLLRKISQERGTLLRSSPSSDSFDHSLASTVVQHVCSPGQSCWQ
uniref:Uncharacterized protein n=1 Tax=Arundo donax TaxID=35708 RepID=A0A0A9GFN0_ARUDO